MKTKTIIIFLFCIISIGSYAQNNEFKVYYGIAEFDFSAKVNGVEVSIDGSGNIAVNDLKEMGINYNRKLSNNISIETGLKFINTELIVSSGVFQPLDSRYEKFEMISIPILANYTFLKYLYVNGGIQVDFQTSNNTIESQSGIGYLVGIGAKYEFNNFLIFVNPNYQRHTVIAFEEDGDKRRLNGKAIHFGLGYKF